MKFRILCFILIILFILTVFAACNKSKPVAVDIPSVGETYRFGDIDWIVLDKKYGKILLLSKYILNTYSSYHNERSMNLIGIEITWNECDLRKYLNEIFYDEFSEEEKNRISETRITNPNNPWYGTNGGKDTDDRIFILSLDEVIKYFGDSGKLGKGEQDQDIFIHPFPGFFDEYDDMRIASNKRNDLYGPRMWWLRSPGKYKNNAAFIYSDGSVCVGGISIENGLIDGFGARPALWLNY